MKPWQKATKETVMRQETGAILLVRPTGNGKSIVKDAVAVDLRGVILTVVLLLTLVATRQKRIKKGSQQQV